MKKTKITLSLFGIILIGCLLFIYTGCSAPESTGGGGGSSASPTPTASGQKGETVIATGRTNPYDIAVSNGYVFWTEKIAASGGVYAKRMDGTGDLKTIASGYPNTYGIAIANADLYFTQKLGPGQGTVMHVDINGNIETYCSGLSNPTWIKFNQGDGYIYWTETVSTNGRLCRKLVGNVNAETQVIAGSMNLPYAFAIDASGGYVYLTQIAGNLSSILKIKNEVSGTQTTLYTGMETYYGTSVTFDGTGAYVYWCDFLSNAGVYRIKTNTATPSLETVESGLARAFDLFGPATGYLYYSLNEQGVNKGGIYQESTSSVSAHSTFALGTSSTVNTPFRFLLNGGSFYWTEYPNFDPLDLDAGGGSQCRVMRYTP